MFGKKKLSQEEIAKLLEQLTEGEALFSSFDKLQEAFEGNGKVIENSYEQMKKDALQVSANEKEAEELSRLQIENSATLLHTLQEKKEAALKALEEYQKVSLLAEKQYKAACDCVEENKHFTTPSKQLGELPETLRAQNASYMEELDVMADYGKQMSVLSLNAAIEAGRMGDTGRAFVSAAEEVRGYARQYEKSVLCLKEKVKQSDAKIAKLEEMMLHIISLLKDNNVANTKLMRDSESLKKQLEQMITLSDEKALDFYWNEVLGIKNSLEEISKLQERNQLQMEDIMSEMDSQSEVAKEIVDAWGKIYESTVVYKRKYNKEG